MATLWKLTETYRGERAIYVEADSKSEALRIARAGDSVQEDDPVHFDYRYRGPVIEVVAGRDRSYPELED